MSAIHKPLFVCFFSLQVISWDQFVENTFWKIQLHTNFNSNVKKKSRRYYFQRMGIYKDELNRNVRTEKVLTEMKDFLGGCNGDFKVQKNAFGNQKPGQQGILKLKHSDKDSEKI